MTGGTRIQLRVSMHPYRAIFLFIWLAGVLGLGGKMLTKCVLAAFQMKTGVTGRPIAGIIGPLLMFAIGVMAVRSERRAAAATEAEVISFLEGNLAARQEGAAQPGR